MKISLCMIVKNEEDPLERCLTSVSDIVDEIIIVNTGSSDRTKEIAEKFTKHVIDFEWVDDFAAARNFAFSHGTMDYIMWLDADDVLLPEERQKLVKLKQSLDPLVDAVSMEYHCDFDDYGNVTLSVRRTRIVKRLKNFQWCGAVHEDLFVDGYLYDSDIVVTHKRVSKTTDRNLKIYENRLSQGKAFTAQDVFHFARELHQHQIYERAIVFYLKYLEDENNSVENKIFTCNRLADCYYQIGDKDKEMAYTFKSFQYDTPRSEACCRLGYHFLEKNAFKNAVYWYKQALEVPLPESSWAIINQPSRTWLPHMQLGLCYYRLGLYDLSYQHNKMALSYRPQDINILHNLSVLEELLEQRQQLRNFLT
ncbi:glycosyltransferase involved in cell wall biosynthesis [Anaerosolibacter carboniphilus]|uniref:Glycosyltransferase involved in cell wall biosynthesis n=1 Tax=Anaerosolibacter carboniphilus TaxID=1417629 RepID=A0A841KQN1_9FIRM|nr:glycosyltransferase involved in cell wall biosynthesis [Anaerosolibacter carboniphilus]